ncbi:TetR/AcrR family transcriptional regulator [Mucilaginibacter sabulilitoris]|uniref:TetR/AcrR family transcriptional regulator n=1 Tax=Mucilaginibacter sabulilitoris TaxID=1173583 RepID=A0ABZ0TNT0_9SPHI|nr:TetR/AcrR family transcriptional regulator [Mucilaginibacter sabulilitoris]WPU94787.1 TetR/AcrR family transcriptional regulator [Mucilaginibacter sabulilitoris]
MKRNQARECIIKTASLLFYKQGYSNTGINQIIDEAGIAKSTLYQHFRSKEDLLIAYLEETGVLTLKALKDAAQSGTTPLEKLVAIFDYLEKLVGMDEFYGCHFLNIVYEMPNREERAREQIRRQKNLVRNLLGTIIEPLNKPELADEIYTLFEGALIAHKVHGANWPIRSAKNAVLQLV